MSATHPWLLLGSQRGGAGPPCSRCPCPSPARPLAAGERGPSACRPSTAQSLCLGAPPVHVNGLLEATCGSRLSDVEVLKVERIQLIDAVLNLCTYHHPENIQLPPG